MMGTDRGPYWCAKHELHYMEECDECGIEIVTPEADKPAEWNKGRVDRLHERIATLEAERISEKHAYELLDCRYDEIEGERDTLEAERDALKVKVNDAEFQLDEAERIIQWSIDTPAGAPHNGTEYFRAKVSRARHRAAREGATDG